MERPKKWIARTSDGKRVGPVADTPEEAARGYFKKYRGGIVDVYGVRAVSNTVYVDWTGPDGNGLRFRQITQAIARNGFLSPTALMRRDVTVAEAVALLSRPDVTAIPVRRDVSLAAIDAQVGGVWHALNITDGTADDVVTALQAKNTN